MNNTACNCLLERCGANFANIQLLFHPRVVAQVGRFVRLFKVGSIPLQKPFYVLHECLTVICSVVHGEIVHQDFPANETLCSKLRGVVLIDVRTYFQSPTNSHKIFYIKLALLNHFHFHSFNNHTKECAVVFQRCQSSHEPIDRGFIEPFGSSKSQDFRKFNEGGFVM